MARELVLSGSVGGGLEGLMKRFRAYSYIEISRRDSNEDVYMN